MSDVQPHNTRKRRTYGNDEWNKKFKRDNGPVTRTQIVADKSDVSKAMFNGETAGNTIHMPDFLKYSNTNNVNLTAEQVEDAVLAVLCLGQSVNDCCQFLSKSLDNENVCSRLSHAIQHKHPELMEASQKQILVNTAAVFKSADFLASDQQVLKHILTMDLVSCTETEVFEAMMSWVKTNSKQNLLTKELVETYLGDLFYEIRFAKMKIEEFCTLANRKEYDPVLSDFHKTITNMIALPHLLDEISGHFKTSPRAIGRYLGADIACERSQSYTLDRFVLDPVHETKFSVSKPLFLTRIQCGGIAEKDYDLFSDLEVDVKICDYRDVTCKDGDGNLLLEMKTNLKSDKSNPILLTQPVIVRPGLFYNIRIGKFSPNHFCYTSKLPRRINMNCGVVIDFYKNDADENTAAYRIDGDTNEDSSDDDDDGYSDCNENDDDDDNDVKEILKADLIRKMDFNLIQI